jgi:putative ABC transport system substrate-binding protein
MNRRDAVSGLIALVAALAPMSGWAQRRIARVGFLGAGALSASPRILAGFKDRMRSLGWIEGGNVEYLVLAADGYIERLDALAQQMVRENVEVIVAGPPPSAVAARKATRTIPIVMGNVPDPVALGLVTSLARPGGNVTGVSSQTSALVGKQLELLKEIAPGARHFGVLYNEKNPSAEAFRAAAANAAASLRVALIESRAGQPGELAAAVQRLAREGAQAVVVPADPMMLGARGVLNSLLAAARLPAAFANSDHAQDGALLSYAPDIVENFRMAAGYVDRILKGANPAELPVEQSSRFELVVNLKTAMVLGLKIPQSLLARADRVIE